MNSLRRILLPTDFSLASDDALREACLVARTFGAEVTLLHAIPEASRRGDQFEFAFSRVAELLDDIRTREACGPVRFAARHVIRAGQPADVVLAAAAELHPDLIVVGAGEKTSMDRILLGSTAERLMREAAAPVWLTRPGRAHPEVRRIVCACDASDPGREALATAIFLARTFVARLSLLTVLPGQLAPLTPLAQALGQTEREADLDQAAAAVSAHLLQFDLHGVEVETVARRGKPAREIVEFVQDSGTDLLVLGEAARHGLARVLRPNTAERVARLVPCSLLAIKRGSRP